MDSKQIRMDFLNTNASDEKELYSIEQREKMIRDGLFAINYAKRQGIEEEKMILWKVLKEQVCLKNRYKEFYRHKLMDSKQN